MGIDESGYSCGKIMDGTGTMDWDIHGLGYNDFSIDNIDGYRLIYIYISGLKLQQYRMI